MLKLWLLLYMCVFIALLLLLFFFGPLVLLHLHSTHLFRLLDILLTRWLHGACTNAKFVCCGGTCNILTAAAAAACLNRGRLLDDAQGCVRCCRAHAGCDCCGPEVGAQIV